MPHEPLFTYWGKDSPIMSFELKSIRIDSGLYSFTYGTWATITILTHKTQQDQTRAIYLKDFLFGRMGCGSCRWETTTSPSCRAFYLGEERFLFCVYVRVYVYMPVLFVFLYSKIVDFCELQKHHLLQRLE